MADLRIEDVTLTDAHAAYAEAHSALNSPLLARYLLAPAVAEAAFLLAGLATAWQWFFIFMGWLIVPIMTWTTMVYRNWPTGIRIDEAAVSIGAVGSARAERRTPTVTHQSRGLFTCPWRAVQSIRVVTDPAELRGMRNAPDYYTLTNRWGTKRGMSYCSTGVLASPFMRAALVIEVDPAAVTTSRIRPARYYSNYMNGYFSRLIPPRPSPVWVVPTRHPEALRKALSAVLRLDGEQENERCPPGQPRLGPS